MTFKVDSELIKDDGQNSKSFDTTLNESRKTVQRTENYITASVTPLTPTSIELDSCLNNPSCFSYVDNETSYWEQYNSTMKSMDSDQLFLWQLEEEEKYDQNVRECITHGRNYPIPPAPKHESEFTFNSSFLWEDNQILETDSIVDSNSNLASLSCNSYMMHQFTDQMQSYKERIFNSKHLLDFQQRKHQ